MYIALIVDAKIKDILPGKSGYNLYLKVVSKNVLVDLTRFDKTRVVIADFIVGDETGIIKMRLRNGKFHSKLDVYTDLVEVGQTIIVRNWKVPVVNQHMRLQVDSFGKIEVSKNFVVEKVDQSKDRTAEEFENFQGSGERNDRNSGQQNNRGGRFGNRGNNTFGSFNNFSGENRQNRGYNRNYRDQDPEEEYY